MVLLTLLCSSESQEKEKVVHTTAQKISNGNRKLTAAKTEAQDYIQENLWPDQTTWARSFAIMNFVAKFMAHLLV